MNTNEFHDVQPTIRSKKSVTPQHVYEPDVHFTPDYVDPPKDNSRTIMIIAVAIVVVLLITVIVYLFTKKEKPVPRLYPTRPMPKQAPVPPASNQPPPASNQPLPAEPESTVDKDKEIVKQNTTRQKRDTSDEDEFIDMHKKPEEETASVSSDDSTDDNVKVEPADDDFQAMSDKLIKNREKSKREETVEYVDVPKYVQKEAKELDTEESNKLLEKITLNDIKKLRESYSGKEFIKWLGKKQMKTMLSQ